MPRFCIFFGEKGRFIFKRPCSVDGYFRIHKHNQHIINHINIRGIISMPAAWKRSMTEAVKTEVGALMDKKLEAVKTEVGGTPNDKTDDAK